MSSIDEQLQRQLVRQLKILNFWITFFGATILIALLIGGFFIYKTVSYVRATSDKVTNIQRDAKDSLNLRKQVCEKDNSATSFIEQRTALCTN